MQDFTSFHHKNSQKIIQKTPFQRIMKFPVHWGYRRNWQRNHFQKPGIGTLSVSAFFACYKLNYSCLTQQPNDGFKFKHPNFVRVFALLRLLLRGNEDVGGGLHCSPLLPAWLASWSLPLCHLPLIPYSFFALVLSAFWLSFSS